MQTEKGGRYSGESGKDYFEFRRQSETLHLGYSLQARLFLPHLNETADVLDFGCGNGSMAAVLERHVASISGLEVNPPAREVAAREFSFPVYGQLGDIPDSRKFSHIVSNHVLEHVGNPIGCLEALRSHLRPDGRLILCLPLEDFRSAAQRKITPDDNHHLHTWTPLLLANSLREAGFHVESIRIINSSWSPRFFFLGRGPLQGVFCFLNAILRKRRQLLAVCTAPSN